MIIYSSSQELTNKIRHNLQKLVADFDTVPEALKDKRIIEVDRTPQKYCPINSVGSIYCCSGNKMNKMD